MHKHTLDRYQRQIILPEIGLEGQKILNNARVLCVGAGGLGAPVLMYLAGAGVGTLGIVEEDTVTLSNLHRQILFNSSQLEQSKLHCAVKFVKAINPEISISRVRIIIAAITS